MHYVYVLRSKKDDDLYIGCTSDIAQRLEQHNAGLNHSTKFRAPFNVIYYEMYPDQEDAFAREKILKGRWGRKYLQRVLKYYWQKHPKRIS